ncbi:hypothetical protein HAX54_010666 [Datura stramonium]|uniref:Uncharacterized protein n=1 Tax=Datura stramonium TaxID=4076 RepID=A0ABS8WY61_DATST|nr:hypothetical protein [Datura stramonium]
MAKTAKASKNDSSNKKKKMKKSENRNARAEQRRIGEARSSATKRCKCDTLKEYEQSAKSSMFVDKRIGENDEGLGEFDKAILRSQRETGIARSTIIRFSMHIEQVVSSGLFVRDKCLHVYTNVKLKKNKYNLSDEDEEDFKLRLFLGRDDFDDEVPFDEDDEYYGRDDKSAILGQLDSHGSQNAQAGPVEAEENAQKAKDREENDELTEQLDKDFTSLVNSKALLSLTQPDKINALKALVNRNVSVGNVKKDEEKPDTYEMLVSEMALDIRARPSNRTKTPEEIAQEEKERLELRRYRYTMAETRTLCLFIPCITMAVFGSTMQERQKRMAASDDESDEDGNASDDNSKLVKDPRTISGDDLGDDLEEVPRTKLGWIGEILRRKESELESEDAASTGDSETIRRIRAFNAITFAAENKKKMQVFYGVLLQYFAVLANKKSHLSF